LACSARNISTSVGKPSLDLKKASRTNSPPRLTHARSRREPIVLLFEDLHWWDGGSAAFLENVVESVSTTRTLLLVNFRPEYHAAWMQRSYYQQLPLLPLGPEAIAELLRDLLGTDPSLAGLGDRIRKRTGGNPFFIEEMVQALAETGSLAGAKGAYRLARPSAELNLPATVQAVLAARIDRLEERDKHVLQTAAVIGKEFSEAVLKRVGDLPEAELAAALTKLTASEFVFERSLYPELDFTFKHALTQEVAYHSFLKERCRALHERTAQAIETLFGDSLEAHYGELAYHYKLSGNTEKTVEYLHLAGEQAAERSANAEAESNLTTALDLLRTLPDTTERDRKEVSLQTALAAVLGATRGFGAPEREGPLERARDLCQRLGESRQLGPVLTNLCQVNLEQGRLRAACELAEQSLRLAEDLQDPAFLSAAHHNAGEAYCWTGEIVRAQAHVEQALALYDRKQHRSHAWLGVDLWILSSSLLAWIEQFVGRSNQALRRSLATVARAREEPSRLFELAIAELLAAGVRQFRREEGPTRELADAAVSLCAEQAFNELIGMGRWMRGWALSELGHEEDGIREIAAGIEGYRCTGSRLFLSWSLGQLAWAHGKIGQTEQAFSRLAEAFEAVDQNGEHFYEAELFRLKGELVLKRPAPDEEESEASFRHAISIARRQSGRTWELRATTSLARLLAKQGKSEEARALLAEIYRWFTEGFDTPDLKDAKALLEELS
jgi:predicted ATPase/DNA-binding IscR family transcriptional regulator